MKNIILSKSSLVLVITAIVIGPAAALAQSYAARRAVDFRMSYNYDQKDEGSVPDLKVQKGSSAQAAEVQEEKTTSPSPSKMQTGPNQRTVRTGLSF